MTAEAGGDIDLEGELRAEERADLLLPTVEQLTQVDGLQRRTHPPGEVQDLIGDALSAADRVQIVIDRLGQLLGRAAADHFEIRLDAHEHVVELVGDRRGDPAQAGHAIRLRQLLRHLLPLGDVHDAPTIAAGFPFRFTDDVAAVQNGCVRPVRALEDDIPMTR